MLDETCYPYVLRRYSGTSGHVNVVTKDGDTPLILAAQNFEIETILLLLEHGANPIPSGKSPIGTALHAVFRANLRHAYQAKPTFIQDLKEVTIALLKAGCNINTPGHTGRTVLHDACFHRYQFPVVVELLDHGPDVNATDDNGNTPLHLNSPGTEQRAVLELLDARGAKLDFPRRQKEGWTPLHCFVSLGGDLGDLAGIRQHVHDWNVAGTDGNTLLHLAVRRHRPGNNTLAELIALGLDPNGRNQHGRQPIHMLDGRLDDIKHALDILLAAGVDLESKDYQGRTFLADWSSPRSQFNYEEVVRHLVDRGANINTQDHKGDSPLHYMCQPRDLDYKRLESLLSLGADRRMQNYAGDTLLHRIAAEFSTFTEDTTLGAIQKLVTAGASSMSLNHKGQTPLHMLSSHVSEHYFIPSVMAGKASIDLVLDEGLIAGINTEDHHGVRPIHLAATISEFWVAKLIERSAVTTAITKDGRNLLHIAATARQSNVIGFLLDHYAAINIDRLTLVNAKCNCGRTPLHEACRPGRLESVLLLLRAGAYTEIAASLKARALESCAEFVEETARWPTAKDSQNKFGDFIAAGIQATDDQRPRPRNVSNNKKHIPGDISEFGLYSETQTVGIIPIIRALISHGTPMTRDIHSISAAFHAVRNNCGEMVVQLERLAAGNGVDLSNYHTFETQYMSLQTKYLPEVLDLFFKADIDTRTVTKLLVLRHHDALAEVIKVIVERFHADVNVQFKAETIIKSKIYYFSKTVHERRYRAGDTALHYLAKGGHWWYEGAIEYLLQHGADPNVQNDNGDTPLSCAVNKGHYGGYQQRWITEILLRAGADPNIPKNCGRTPLASSVHDTQLFRLLVEYGATPSSQYPSEVLSALECFNRDVLLLLLDMGIDLNTAGLGLEHSHWHTMRAHNNPGGPRNTFLSPLCYISMLPFNEPNSRDHAIEMIKLLLDRGADPFLPCDEETTILHDAFERSVIIQPFLDLPGLDLERRDARGRTLLLAASSCPTGTNSYACKFSQLPRICPHMTAADYDPSHQTRAMALYERGVDPTAVGNNTIHLLVSVTLPGANHNQNQHAVEAFRNTVALFLDDQPHLRDQRNTAGETPADIARRNGNQWAVEALQA